MADVINNVWEGGRQSKRFETLGLCAKANRLDLAKDWKKWLCDLGIVMKGLSGLTLLGVTVSFLF